MNTLSATAGIRERITREQIAAEQMTLDLAGCEDRTDAAALRRSLMLAERRLSGLRQQARQDEGDEPEIGWLWCPKCRDWRSHFRAPVMAGIGSSWMCGLCGQAH